MHFLVTLLPALAAHSTLILANPLKIDISLTSNGELFDLPGSEKVAAATDSTTLDDVRTKAPMPLENPDRSLSQIEAPPPRVLFWTGEDFTGTKKRYQVVQDKCYDLPRSLAKDVLSAKLESNVWYCTFFPERSCQAEPGSDKVYQLPAGEYESLSPEGMDYVSFSCKLYDRGHELGPEGLSSLSTVESSKSRRPTFVQTVMSLLEGKPIMDTPSSDSAAPDSLTDSEVDTFVPSVQLYLLPGFQGPFSDIPYYPGTWGCVPLATPIETGFQSIRMGEEFKSCKFFSHDACRGQVLLDIKETTPFVRETRHLPLKTMYCSFES